MKKIGILKFVKDSKNNKAGITLIALVITIIVLLILAGIGIFMLTRESSMVNKASQAKTITEGVQAQERLQQAVEELKMDYYKKRETMPLLDYIFSEGAREKLQSELGEITFGEDVITYNGIPFKVVDDGIIKEANDILLSRNNLELRIIDDTIYEDETLNATLMYLEGDITWTSSTRGVVKIEESGDGKTVKLTALNEGTVVLTAACSGKTAACEVTVKKSGIIGDYVSYPVNYTDMYTDYEFGKNGASDAWRVLSLTANQNGTYNVDIISTGIPAFLYYNYNTNIGKDTNGWWGTSNDVREVFASDSNVESIANAGYDYSVTGSYPNYFAAAGFQKNFRLITFEAKSTSLTANKGGYKKINGITSGNVTGEQFISGGYNNISVRNLTYAEISAIRGRLGSNSSNHYSNDKGVFYLRALEIENPDFGYVETETANKTATICTYWGVSPGGRRDLYYVHSEGSHNYYDRDASHGVRPVVSIKGINMIRNKDTGVWTITQP